MSDDRPCKTGRYWDGYKYCAVVPDETGIYFEKRLLGIIRYDGSWEARVYDDADGSWDDTDGSWTEDGIKAIVEAAAPRIGQFVQRVGRWTPNPCPLGREDE